MIDQVRAEVRAGEEFAAIVADLVEVNEAICLARMEPSRTKPGPKPQGEKGGP